MKTKLLSALALLMLSLGTKAQNVTIPDAEFKAKLLSSSSSNTIAKNLQGNYFKIDSNGDGEIQQSEANQVGALELIQNPNEGYNENPPIGDYQGILSFVNINKIKINYSTSSINADLKISNLNKLEDLDIYISEDSKSLSVNNCPSLKNLTVGSIILESLTNTPAVKSVDILFERRKNLQKNLTDIEKLSNLEKIKLSKSDPDFWFESEDFNPPLKETLNLSHHKYLKEVEIEYLGLKELNLSHCNVLNSLNITRKFYSGHSTFGNVDVSNCPSLIAIDLNEHSSITGLNADNCPNLKSIQCKSVNLETFSANNNPLLNEIKLDSYDGTDQMQMANCPNLKTISIQSYRKDSFDATAAANLEHLYLDFRYYSPGHEKNFLGPLKTLTIDQNLKLKSLKVINQKLTQLNIDGLPKLEEILVKLYYNNNTDFSPQPDFSTEFLQSVNIQNCAALAKVDFQGQEALKNITIKNCASLTNLEHLGSAPAPYRFPQYDINQLETVDVEGCPALSTIKIVYSKMNSLKLKNTGVKTIDVSHNDLANLELVNNNKLTELTAYKNKLTSLDFSTLPNSLKKLDVSYNLLASTSGKSSFIKELNISNNNLTDFNIHNLPNIETLIMGRNKIVDIDFSGHKNVKTINEFDELHALDNMEEFGQPAGFVNPPTFTKTFNVNNCTSLENIFLESTSLEKVFVKNGVNEIINFLTFDQEYPNLQLICCDTSQVETVKQNLESLGISCEVNDYCTADSDGKNNGKTAQNNKNNTLSDVTKNNQINIYPNPTKGEVSIDADSKIKSIEVYDLQGNTIHKQLGINAEKTTISIHNATAGTYIFKVVTEKETSMKKVIKN